MKKYILTFILIAFIIPSVALASWWNPLSWFNNWSFHKKEVVSQVQVEEKTSEEKIKELQKQLDDLKKQQPNSNSTTTITEKSPKPVQKIPDISEVKITTPIPPPTAQQVAGLTRLCASAISQGKLTKECGSGPGTLWEAYYSDLTFRNQVDIMIAQYDAFLASQSAAYAKQFQQTNCDYILNSDLSKMTPWAGDLAIKEACGTATDTDRISYQMSELQNQLSGLKTSINKAEAFQRSALERVQSKPQTFGTTKWEVRFGLGDDGSISSSTGERYSFHCSLVSCVTY